jgi:DNA repair protein RadC
VDRTTVFPRRVVELALERKASGFILVHNHPNGRPEPSAEDDLLTRRLKSAASAVDLRLVDHLIVAREGIFSYRQRELI